MQKIPLLMQKMIDYYVGDPKRIQHFIKVHSLARLIGLGENLNTKEQYILELTALVHDIGIKKAEQKYGKCSGKLQEQEGPAVAYAMLKQLDIEEHYIERVCYLVGHHHTYTHMNGLDYQILVESDFLVNFFEDNSSPRAINSVLKKIFKTKTGIQICKTMFNV